MCSVLTAESQLLHYQSVPMSRSHLLCIMATIQLVPLLAIHFHFRACLPSVWNSVPTELLSIEDSELPFLGEPLSP